MKPMARAKKSAGDRPPRPHIESVIAAQAGAGDPHALQAMLDLNKMRTAARKKAAKANPVSNTAAALARRKA